MKVVKANAGASVPAAQKVKAAMGGTMVTSKEKAKAIPKKAVAAKVKAKMVAPKAKAMASMVGSPVEKSVGVTKAFAKGGMAKKKGY